MPYLSEKETFASVSPQVKGAYEFYRDHPEFWIIPVDEKDTDATLRKVHEYAAAYAQFVIADGLRRCEALNAESLKDAQERA